MTDTHFSLPDNLKNLPSGVTLIAVSKQQPQEKIQQALDAGIRQFGENKVQEACRHWEKLRGYYPDLILHLIGPLQSNKTRESVALFDVIHTVDREKIALALKNEMTRQKKNIPCFIQVNTGKEEQKSGVAPEKTKEFYAFCTGIGLTIIGLMCIPPADEDPVPHFKLLKNLSREIGVKNLSMGMSGDYAAAVKEGATHIRVGTALFGER